MTEEKKVVIDIKTKVNELNNLMEEACKVGIKTEVVFLDITDMGDSCKKNMLTVNLFKKL